MHVLLAAGHTTGLSIASVTLLNQIRTVDRRRLIKRLGVIDRGALRHVDDAIRISLAVN